MKTNLAPFNLLLFFYIAIPAQAASLPPQEMAPLYLEVGEQRILSFPQLEKYSLTGNSVHHVRLRGKNELLLKAVRPGIASLTVILNGSRSQTRALRVELKKAFNRPAGLLQALGKLNSVEAIDEGEHFILRGQVGSSSEATAVAYLREKYSNLVVDECEIEPIWYQKTLQKLSELLQSYPSVELKTEEGLISILGNLNTPIAVKGLTQKIKAINPMVWIDLQSIQNHSPTLYFKVFLLEVKKEYLSSLGVDWKTPHTGAFQISPTQFQFGNSIDLSINALSETGRVRILSSPELVVRAPGQAELFAGGELPIRQRSKFADNIIWKNIGLSLKLDVKELGADKVRLNIETEMSHLDKALSNDEIPGVQSNRLKTQVDGILSRPLLLSGLLQEGLRERVKGLPGLSRLPIIGSLFGSEDFQNDRSELVAILLPYRQPPPHPIDRLQKYSNLPKGYIPLPRNFVSEHEKEKLRSDRDFPWNVL